MTLIEQIKEDMERGVAGPWKWQDEDECLVGPFQVVMYQDEEGRKTFANYPERGTIANATRIARVPDMEAALIAAEELAEAVERSDPWEDIDAALTAYRNATGASQ